MNTLTTNPWRTAVIAIAILVPTCLAIGAGALALRKTDSATQPRVERSARAPAATPSPAVVEACRAVAAGEGDLGRIAKNGAIGGAVGAVRQPRAARSPTAARRGQGAGIGALVGVTVGALYGLNEKTRNRSARAAYADCLARRGY
jgi:hypothetical protein